MKVAVPGLAPLFRSDTQGRLLAAVFVAPDDEHSITELANRAGTSVPTALREIDRAESTGVVTVRRVGNTRLVRANAEHPLYESIYRLVLATYGPPAVLAQEFENVAGIEVLLIFGSWAARYSGVSGRAPNDIDVLVVGSPTRAEVHEAAERAERRIGMPVQATIRSTTRWRQPKDDPFIAEINARPIVPVFGGIA
jgi:predicted nucleotidyltransferase